MKRRLPSVLPVLIPALLAGTLLAGTLLAGAPPAAADPLEAEAMEAEALAEPGTAEPPGAAPQIACPAELAVSASAAAVPDWQMVSPADGKARLERMAIRTAPDQPDGLPQTGFLRMEQGARRTILARWDLAEARVAHPDLWLACHYAGTTIALVRTLPAAVTRCEYRVESTDIRLEETASCR